MNINAVNLKTLWMEDQDGNVWEPNLKEGYPGDVPEGFIYQHSRFPTTISETILELIQKEDVEACSHPAEDVIKTYGWIDGVEGRRCRRCYGDQTKKLEEAWPDKWDAGSCRELVRGNSSWPSSLALAMVRPSIWERTKSFFRTGRFSKLYTLDEAIIIASSNCERCMNALAYQYGLDWGYKEGSDEWQKSRTCCDFCSKEQS